MRSTAMPHQGRQFAFEVDADESLWAMRDYFWAVGSGILDDPGRDTCRNRIIRLDSRDRGQRDRWPSG